MRFPFLDLGHRAQHGPYVDAAHQFGAAGVQAVQEIDRHHRQDGAKPERFVEGRDEEGVASGLDKRLSRLFEAGAVGIGFHDGGALRAARALRERLPVRGECREIDGQQSCRFGGERVGHGA